MKGLITGIVVTAAVGMGIAPTASAETYGFMNISNNIAGDAAIGEAQLTVTVFDAGGGLVGFLFENSGLDASSITDVYFDDGSLFDIASITNTAGLVEFTELASPGNLPSANSASPPFVTTIGFSADSDPPIQPLGVNPGEELTITYSLLGGQTLADVINELNNGTLRIGIHVQGFDSGGSESFVNTGLIPLPPALAMGLVGLVGVAVGRKRYLKKSVTEFSRLHIE